MRKIVWTEEAISHLEAILAYVSAFNPGAASRLGERLIAVADGLAEFSERGRDAGEGRREMTSVEVGPKDIGLGGVTGNGGVRLRMEINTFNNAKSFRPMAGVIAHF